MKHRSLTSFFLALGLITSVFCLLAWVHSDSILISLQEKSTPVTLYRLKVPPPKKKAPTPRKKQQPPNKVEKKKPMPQKKAVPSPTPEEKVIVEDLPEEDKVLDVSQLDTPVFPISRISPKYPKVAKAKGEEAQVLLEIIISKKGAVEFSRVVFCSNPGYGFEESALRAVQLLRFDPIQVEGVPQRVKLVYPIEFVLVN